MKTHEQLVALACFFAAQPEVSRVILVQLEPTAPSHATIEQPVLEEKKSGRPGGSPFSFAENGYTIGTTTYSYE